jgi:hypothetical protein
MVDIIKALLATPLPILFILGGLLCLLLFLSKNIGGMEVANDRRNWALPIGLGLITLGMVLNTSPSTPYISTSPTPSQQFSTPQVTPSIVSIPSTTPSPTPSVVSKNRFIREFAEGGYFPRTCGDISQRPFYPIFIPGSRENLAKVRAKFCTDAERERFGDKGRIQVATIGGDEKSAQFTEFIGEHFEGAERGAPE